MAAKSGTFIKSKGGDKGRMIAWQNYLNIVLYKSGMTGKRSSHRESGSFRRKSEDFRGLPIRREKG